MSVYDVEPGAELKPNNPFHDLPTSKNSLLDIALENLQTITCRKGPSMNWLFQIHTSKICFKFLLILCFNLSSLMDVRVFSYNKNIVEHCITLVRNCRTSSMWAGKLNALR